MSPTRNDCFIIVNPHAGSGKTLAGWNVASARLDAHSVPYKAVFTSCKHHAEKLAREAAAEGWRTIIAVGGDGSVHEMFTGVLDWCAQTDTDPGEFRLGVIPIGSGNDWIRSLGIPHDVRRVVDLIAAQSYGRQDVIKVSDAAGKVSYMANIGGAGFDSDVCVRVNAKKEKGQRSRFIYVISLLNTILHMKSFDAGIVLDGQPVFEGECISVAFGNGRYSGGGMRQTSISEMDDGLIDVLIVPKVSLLRIARELPRLFNGTIHKAECLIYRRCKRLEMKTSPAIPYEIDGEVEGSTPVSLEFTGQQVNVLRG